MPELTITVRDNDMVTLTEITTRDWRTLELEASALLETAIATERAKAARGDKPAIVRRGPRAQSAAA